MKKSFSYFAIFLAIVFFISPLYTHAADVSVQNTGFVPANIWYSKTPFYAGETIRIHTVIYNGSTYDLSGAVEFLDNDALVGRVDFSLLPTGQVRDVSTTWKVLEGKHVMTARIVNASISLQGGPKTAIALENDQAAKSEVVADIDPAVKAAQAQAAAAKTDTTPSQQTQGVVSSAIQTVNSVIPEPVKADTAASVNAVENLRTSLGTELRVAKENKSKDIDAIVAHEKAAQAAPQNVKKNTGVAATISSATEKPFAYVAYGVLALLQYFFEWRILFYGVLFYVLYRMIKWAVQKIRDR